MANRIVGNVYIIDSAQTLTGLPWSNAGYNIQSAVFYGTDTSGEIVLADSADTRNTMIRIRSNQATPFSFPIYLGGCRFNQLTPIVVTAGTCFLYLDGR